MTTLGVERRDDGTWVMEARDLTLQGGEILAAGITTAGTEARMEQPEPNEAGGPIMVWRDGLRISAGSGAIFETPGTDTDTDPTAPATVPLSILATIVDSLGPAQ